MLLLDDDFVHAYAINNFFGYVAARGLVADVGVYRHYVGCGNGFVVHRHATHGVNLKGGGGALLEVGGEGKAAIGRWIGRNG